MSEYYDPDNDARPHSPLLEAVKPRATPSPSPPPFLVQQPARSLAPRNLSPSSRGRRKLERRKTRPSQGDFVLIRVMEPNRPDIARLVGERALNSDSGSESEEDDMDDQSVTGEAGTAEPIPLRLTVSRPPPADNQLEATAQRALDTLTSNCPPPVPRDSVVEIDGQPRSVSDLDGDSPETVLPSRRSLSTITLDNHPTPSEDSRMAAVVPSQRKQGQMSTIDSRPRGSSSVSSPALEHLAITQSMGQPDHRLPALQPPHSPLRDGPGSPNLERLPPFRTLAEMAETVISEHQETARGRFTHRPSVSSSAHSPTSIARQSSISSALSINSTFPLSATSPSSANSESASRDLFLRAGQSGLSLFSPRRPSQASETAVFSNLNSASVLADTYPSSEGVSPGTQPTAVDGIGHRMSIDEVSSRTLPVPPGAHMPNIPILNPPGHKCDFPGCTAPPFQTQYLLNSHANVHSQTRTHFCPVAGCSRAEGGKGFKRKNEMIRHGLVHTSPGYICPFCPDREHKYPRPDNLQRHVRVHHPEKEKTDPQLREVLAQRPDGGSRGRRRRVGSTSTDFT